jgi:hypothetical protein
LTPICNAGTRDIPVNITIDNTITANFGIIFVDLRCWLCSLYNDISYQGLM